MEIFLTGSLEILHSGGSSEARIYLGIIDRISLERKPGSSKHVEVRKHKGMFEEPESQ